MINPIENHVIVIILCLVTSLSAIIDIWIQKIPNLLTFPVMVLALCYYTGTNGWEGFLFSLKGIATGIGLLVLPWLLGGMGAGDAKLLGAVGGLLGASATIVAFLYIAIIGCACAGMVIVLNRHRFKGFIKDQLITLHLLWATRKYVPAAESEQRRRPRVYYGIPIALGTLCYVVLELTGHQLIT